MLGILLAATVAAAPPAPPPAVHQLRCPAVQQKTVATDRPGLKRLGDLPDPELYRAVWKTAAGCPIDEVYQNGRWIDRWSGRPKLRSADTKGDGR